jgi:Tfp pilus assembly protein PilF
MLAAPTKRITIRVTPDYGPDTACVRTEGLSTYGCPELEWLWSPAGSWKEAVTILGGIARYLVQSGPVIGAGDLMRIDEKQITVCFLGKELHAGDEPDVRPMLEVKTVDASLLTVPEPHQVSAVGHNGLGNDAFNRGETGPAIDEYQKAIAADPTYAMPHRNLSLLYHVLGRLDDAVAESNEYFRLAPAGTRDADAHYNLGVMLAQHGRDQQAIAQYEAALAIDPQLSRALTNLGLIYFCSGQIDRAVALYRRALAADPDFVLAAYNLGLAYVAQQNYLAAVAQLEAVREKDPRNVQASGNLAVLYTRIGRQDAAIGILRELIAQAPSNPVLHFNLASAYQEQGRLDEAQAEFGTVLDLEPPGSRRGLRARRERQLMKRAGSPGRGATANASRS